jgi:hypothetical protein
MVEANDIEATLESMAGVLEIPPEQREAFRDIVLAFKEGGTRIVRNVLQQQYRRSRKPPRESKLPATIALLENTDFENGDPADRNLVREAQRFAMAFARLKKIQPDIETPERTAKARAAWRLAKAHHRLKPAGV